MAAAGALVVKLVRPRSRPRRAHHPQGFSERDAAGRRRPADRRPWRPALARAAEARPGDADDWTGFGGVGDYARSNGNTKAVLDAAHRVRDRVYATAAGQHDRHRRNLRRHRRRRRHRRARRPPTRSPRPPGGAKTCLVLENHPIFGGGAKQNEFLVNGVRLVGPQASNQFGVPRARRHVDHERDVDGLRLAAIVRVSGGGRVGRRSADSARQLRAHGRRQRDAGGRRLFLRRAKTAPTKPTWLRNIWQNDLADAPFSPEVRADLLRWRTTSGETTDEFRRRLDTMTYAQYLEGVLKLRPEVTAFVAPVVGLINGAGPDAVSAFAASQIGMPGVARVRSRHRAAAAVVSRRQRDVRAAFREVAGARMRSPARRVSKACTTAASISAALDRKGQPTRIRLGATVVRIEHAHSAADGEHVVVAYELGGKVYRAKARAPS